MYEDIKKIYDKTRLDYFVMATAHLLDIGWKTAESITDEDIANTKGNGFMTDEFCQYLNELAREIAQTCSPTEFIQFCQVEKIFSTKGYKTRKRR